MNNNKDFLRQFFKEQNIFQPDENISVNKKNEEITQIEHVNFTKKIDKKQFTSHKNINLKALFKTIEEEKAKIKEVIIKQNTEKFLLKKKKKQVSPFHSFYTPFKLKKQENVIKVKKNITQNSSLHTNFQKFTTKKEDKNEKIIKKTEIIEDIISFNQIIQNKKKHISLENILESKSKGKKRLSRIDQNNVIQKEYLLDLWEKNPERYSNHDEISKKQRKLEDTIQQEDRIAKEKQAILQQNKEKRITEIQNEQNKYAQKIKILEKNRKKQEIKKNIIKEFNSYSNLFSEKIKKTTTFFTQYLHNYKKQRKLKQILLQQKEEKQSAFFIEAKEWIKISGLIATVFIVGTFSLRAPGFIAQYEEYLNPIAFAEQQNSLSNLLQKTENPFKNIESLPVAGIKNIAQNITTNAFLTITPPDKRIIIPKIAKNIPILDVDPINLENGRFSDFEADIQKILKKGVVHYPGTAEPGQNGNLFITGHSSYYPWDNGKYKDVFAALHNLKEGDEYYIFDKGKKYKYVITTRKIVSPYDVSVLDQDYTKKTSTLMTCTPVGTAKNRLILQSELVEVGY